MRDAPPGLRWAREILISFPPPWAASLPGVCPPPAVIGLRAERGPTRSTAPGGCRLFRGASPERRGRLIPYSTTLKDFKAFLAGGLWPGPNHGVKAGPPRPFESHNPPKLCG